MNILTRLKSAALAFRYSSWDTLRELLGHSESASGVSVTASNLITLSSAYNAQVLVSETMSTVPLQIFRKSSDGREEYSDHPLYEVLHVQANPTESAQAFRQRFVWDLELYGIGLAEVIRDGLGRVRQLWHIQTSDLSEIERRSDQLWFHIGERWLPAAKLFYCYGPGQNGLTPCSRLNIMRESVGLGLAANEFGARFFSNGTHLGGFVNHPKQLKDEAYNRLKASMNEKYKGLGKSNQVVLLEDGLTFTPVGNTNEDSQFLETRQFQIGEIARFYNIPPHLIGDLQHSTFSNIEHQGIQAVRYSWRPRANRIEAAINTQLIAKEERSTVYAEHNMAGLMQGDFMSQMQGWHLAVQDGLFNADEVRKWLNMNNQSGGQGSIYFMPSNMYNKQDVKDGKTLKTDQNAQNMRGNTDISQIKAQKHDFYADFLKNSPSVDNYRAFALSIMPAFADEFKSRFSAQEYQKSVEKLLASQEKRTKSGFSDDEYPRMRNAFRYAAMQASGVRTVVWRSKPDCPHCQHLNGQTRPINEPFADGIRHAPLASGCECDIEEADHA